MALLTAYLCYFLLASAGVALGNTDNELRIINASEFITFAKSSSDYSGATVYLESDLDFSGGLSEQFEPIGKDLNSPFSGTFDGQGHTISNLAIKSSSIDVGLFGYSTGTIKSVVVDSSCSVTCNYAGDESTHVAGVVGYIESKTVDSFVSNVVNMADVTFEGSVSGSSGLFLGGISGYITSSPISTVYFEMFVRNCVNYGSIRYSGSSPSSRIGGIVGYSYGYASDKKSYIQNCLNYGTITTTGSGYPFIGGITGVVALTELTNCMSSGAISSETVYKGSITGYVETGTNIKHCLWTSDVGRDKACGHGTPVSMEDSSIVSINTTTLNDLNEYAANNSWSKWLLNENSKTLTLKVINGDKGYALSSQLLLLPGSDIWWSERTGWSSDESYETPFDSSEIAEDTALYGRWDKHTATFDSNGGGSLSFTSKTVTYNGVYGEFPEAPSRTGYSFLGWSTESAGGEKVETDSRVTSDHTLYAQWTPNNYTATFNANGDDELEVSEKIVTFNNTYGILPTPNRIGYSFLGWLNEMDEIITSETTVTITRNHTLTAQWSINNYTITFDFMNGTTVEGVFEYNEAVEYPEGVSKEGYTLAGWSSSPEYMPAENIRIEAQWVANNYAVTFDANGGDELEISEKIITFNSSYGILPTSNMTGYRFLGWFTENNESITSETTVSIARNHTLTAQWEEIPSSHVEIVFGTKYLTEDDVRDIIMKYTANDFEIIKFEDDNDGLKVIIKFKDKDEAEKVIERIRSSSSIGDTIKSISFNFEKLDSLSRITSPFLSFFQILFMVINHI